MNAVRSGTSYIIAGCDSPRFIFIILPSNWAQPSLNKTIKKERNNMNYINEIIKIASSEIIETIKQMRMNENLSKNELILMNDILELIGKSVLEVNKEEDIEKENNIFCQFTEMILKAKDRKTKKAIMAMREKVNNNNNGKIIKDNIKKVHDRMSTPKEILGNIEKIKIYDYNTIVSLGQDIPPVLAIFIVISYRFNCLNLELLDDLKLKGTKKEAKSKLIEIIKDSDMYKINKENSDSYIEIIDELFDIMEEVD
jgi:hypothetical protein